MILVASTFVGALSRAAQADTLLQRRYTRLHLPEPDYSRPLLEVSPEHRARLLKKLTFLYGAQRAEAAYPELERLMRVYHAHKSDEMIAEDATFDARERFTEKDAILITYGDLITAPGRLPLVALTNFLDTFMRGAINTVHILPFFPYSSDRGFSIVDYEEVDPRLGNWAQLEDLGIRFRLMFDGVFNHASAKSRWFQSFLNGAPGFEDFFVAFNTKDAIDRDHLRLIMRPRTTELLTPFRSINGSRFVWTTFSPDQVDLNFRNEKVMLRVMEILLHYVRRGADIVRLDAVTYIWRELGTRCAHLRETHVLVQLFRAVLDVVAPQVALVTETNVPHADNVSYFGDGTNEAQMVYNFALPPLVLHTFHTGDSSKLTAWARKLVKVSDTATYFNFLDSHDGIGLLGAQGILTPAEIDALVQRVKEHGGLVSYRTTGDGTQSPYELNITWYSALNKEGADEPQEIQIDRFIASRAIALALRGVPGVYLPSAFGAKNDTAAVLAGSEARSINRKTIDEQALYAALSDRDSWVHLVATRGRRLVRRRIAIPAFHPNADQDVLSLGSGIFGVRRRRTDVASTVVAVVNVTNRERRATLSRAALGIVTLEWHDVISGRGFETRGGALDLVLPPYEVLWLVPDPPAAA